MRHLDLKGRLKHKNIAKNKVDWAAASKSKFQKAVKDFLREYWEYDLVYEEMPLVGTRLSLDLVNYTRKVAIEVQGAQHGKFIGYFHGNRNGFRRQLERDDKKQKWCEINKYQLVEIFPDDLKNLSKSWFFEKFEIIL